MHRENVKIPCVGRFCPRHHIWTRYAPCHGERGSIKIKVFRITPKGITTPPCIVVGACAYGERENSMCWPILPMPLHLDALSPVPWRAGVEKIKVFRITPEGVTTPPCIVVGACAQGELENSMCRPILPTPPHLDALSPVPWRAGVEKIKFSELHRNVSRHLLLSW